MSTPRWSTACPDWEERIVAGKSLIPFDPLFPSEAAAALDIFKALRIVDVPGRPTMGQASRQWVLDFVAAIFGAYDAESGRRLIRYFLNLVAKKNTKSTIGAGVMVTALLRNWRESGEFYILAPTKEVADNSFFPARDMVLADEDLRQILHVQGNFRKITHRNTGAFLKVVAADSETVSGKKTIGLLVDELWSFGKRANAEPMIREVMGGLAARPEGFVVYLSTQSDAEPAGIFKQKLQEFRDIRDGKIVDPESLPIIYEFPKAMIESKAYEDPANWHITNPNLGVVVDAHYLTTELAKAKRNGKASLNDFLAKHLNIEIGQALRENRWAGAEHWPRREDKTLTFDRLLERSEVVVVGTDGGGLDDLFGLNVLGRCRETKHWLSWSHAWCHEGVLELRKSIAPKLLEFADDGDLTIVDDELADISEIISIIADINGRGLLAAVAVDPAGLGELIDELAGIGIKAENKQVIGAPQGFAMMNAIKTAERKAANGTLWHAPSKMMDWCVGNVKIEPLATAIRATKQNAGEAKIDPWCALMNCVSVMSTNPAPRAALDVAAMVA